jgi:hypothetical protein
MSPFHLRAASVTAAVAASLIAFPVTANAAGPAPVTNLKLSSKDGTVYASWTPSTNTGAAKACWQPQTPPATPADPTATCSDIVTSPGYSFAGTVGVSYGVSVFSYDASTQAFGSPASGTVTAVDDPPLPVTSLHTVSVQTGRLTINWTDNPANTDTASFQFSYAEGLDAPDSTSGSATGHSYSVNGTQTSVCCLDASKVYTFEVRVKDHGGNLSDPVLLHATARDDGVRMRDTHRHDGAIADSVATNGVDEADVSAQHDGHLRVIVANYHKPVYVSRTPATTWSKPLSLLPEDGTGSGNLRDVHIGATPGGRVLAAFANRRGASYLIRTNGKWSKLKLADGNTADRVLGATIDPAGHLHLLVRRPNGDFAGLWYFTSTGGAWTQTRVPGSGGHDDAFMTLDPVTHDVVLIDHRNGKSRETLRYVVVGSGRTRVPTLTTWLSDTDKSATMTPTSVASVGGQITVALQRSTTPTADGQDGVYVIRASGTQHHAPQRLPLTSNADVSPVVTALQSDHVVVAWRRTNPSWSPNDMGVWTAVGSGGPGASWSFAQPQKWTSSGYDYPVAATRDDRGHLYVIYKTVKTDVSE